MIFDGTIMMLVGIVLVKLLEKIRRYMKSRSLEHHSGREETHGKSVSSSPSSRSPSPLVLSRFVVEDSGTGASGSTSTSMRPSLNASRVATSRDLRGNDVEEPHEEPPASSALAAQPKIYSGRRRAPRHQPVQVAYFAPSGKRFHKTRDCRGLRNANQVEGFAICQACQRQTHGQREYSQALWLYQDEVDRLHKDARCETVRGAMLEVRCCSFCAGDQLEKRLELRARPFSQGTVRKGRTGRSADRKPRSSWLMSGMKPF